MQIPSLDINSLMKALSESPAEVSSSVQSLMQGIVMGLSHNMVLKIMTFQNPNILANFVNEAPVGKTRFLVSVLYANNMYVAFYYEGTKHAGS